ncbi:uncharacterized protein LOC143358399 [Halictus rubicundus]|uniref:uncharacterized protein LOC143358399 n=1 Tax=Halictus rubicundus TaxID=77578 RepID=UPI004036E9F8
MSLTAQTNKWSPKLIIIFQLTVWTVVGIILLRKGAKSLRDIQDTLRNDTADTQERIARLNEKESIQESSITENRHRIAEIVTRRKDVAMDFNSSEAPRRNKIWLSRKPYASYRAENVVIKKRTTAIDRKQDPRGIRAIQSLRIRASNENKDERVRNKVGAGIYDEAAIDTTNLYDTEESALLQSTHPDSTNFTSLTSIDKIERKSQRAPVNKIGVAVAITMLAIGVVMLLLGPLIVILRAYSDRRRSTQIFLKSRCHSDRPPTYEEVVLMDQAPRYSTLQLDTIPESSPSL